MKKCAVAQCYLKKVRICAVTEFHFRKAYQSHYSSVIQMINNLGWRSCLILFYKIVYGLVEISLPPYIQRQVRMTRSMHPYHFIQLHTSPNYSKYSFFSSGYCAVEQPPFFGCPFWWPDHVQVCHLHATSEHAIIQESLFLSAFKLLLLPHTNTILHFLPPLNSF